MDGTKPVGCAYQLGVGERLSYKRDFTQELVDDSGNVIANVVSADWTYEPDDGELTLSNPWIDDPIVGVYISTPKRGTYYRVTVTVSTSTNETHEEVIGIGGIQISGN